MGKNRKHHSDYGDVTTFDTKGGNTSTNVDKVYENALFGKRTKIKCRNEHQKEFLRVIETNDIILCNGPAGCGKSHLSLVKALDLIQQDNNKLHKLYIMTPAVEIGTKIGHLPGSMDDKLSPFLSSCYKLIDKTIGKKQRDVMTLNGEIEILNVGYIRGENIENSILIVEEAQNFSKKEMLTILTRICEGSKLIISGDVMQIDAFNRKEDSGLYHAIENLKNIKDVGIFEFTDEDIVRHRIISTILEKY